MYYVFIYWIVYLQCINMYIYTYQWHILTWLKLSLCCPNVFSCSLLYNSLYDPNSNLRPPHDRQDARRNQPKLLPTRLTKLIGNISQHHRRVRPCRRGRKLCGFLGELEVDPPGENLSSKDGTLESHNCCCCCCCCCLWEIVAQCHDIYSTIFCNSFWNSWKFIQGKTLDQIHREII